MLNPILQSIGLVRYSDWNAMRREYNDLAHQVMVLREQIRDDRASAGTGEHPDTARLNWLERTRGYIAFDGNPEDSPFPWRAENDDESVEEWGESAREALDKAIEASNCGSSQLRVMKLLNGNEMAATKPPA